MPILAHEYFFEGRAIISTFTPLRLFFCHKRSYIADNDASPRIAGGPKPPDEKKPRSRRGFRKSRALCSRCLFFGVSFNFGGQDQYPEGADQIKSYDEVGQAHYFLLQIFAYYCSPFVKLRKPSHYLQNPPRR